MTALVEELEALLYTKYSSKAVYIIKQLFDYLQPLSTEIMKKVIELFSDLNATGQRHWLHLIWKMLSGSSETLSYLVDNEVCEVIQDAMMDSTKNLDTEVAMWLFNLSLAPLEDLIKINDNGTFSLLLRFLQSQAWTTKVMSLKWIINILKTADFQLWMDLLEKGFLKGIKEWVGVLNHNDTNYWALWTIYEFLWKDELNKTFAIEFQDYGGIEAMESIQNICPTDQHNKIIGILTRFYWNDDEAEVLDFAW